MRQAVRTLTIETHGAGLTDVSGRLRAFVAEQGIETGLLTVWCRHTSASLIVQENADPDVRADLVDFLNRLVPEGAGYRHADEGPDDMPAHIKAALTLTQVSMPVVEGRLVLGTWQAVYVWEHRRVGSARELVVHLLGEFR